MANNFRRVRLAAHGTFNRLVYTLTHRQGFDPSNTIMVFGSIRSGSTWIAEVLSSVSGHLQVFEPLNPDYVSDVRRLLPGRNPYVPVTRIWPEGRDFFNKVLSGQLINSWMLSQATVGQVLRAKRLVVKFVRGNLLLDWMTTNLAVLPPVLIIRHPCAIIASQLNKGWQPSSRSLLGNSYLDKYPQIRDACESLSHPEQVAALAWCLRYHAPLMSAKPYRFMLVTYENLVRNGRRELHRIFENFQIPLNAAALQRLSTPSNTVTKDSQIVAGKDPLAGWQETLSSRQVEDILAVLDIFGMDFYSSALEPDYAKLLAFGSQRTNG